MAYGVVRVVSQSIIVHKFINKSIGAFTKSSVKSLRTPQRQVSASFFLCVPIEKLIDFGFVFFARILMIFDQSIKTTVFFI